MLCVGSGVLCNVRYVVFGLCSVGSGVICAGGGVLCRLWCVVFGVCCLGSVVLLLVCVV
jgi:hypothetical protein